MPFKISLATSLLSSHPPLLSVLPPSSSLLVCCILDLSRTKVAGSLFFISLRLRIRLLLPRFLYSIIFYWFIWLTALLQRTAPPPPACSPCCNGKNVCWIMCVCLCVWEAGEECVMQAKSNVDKWKFETIYAQFTEIAVGHIKLTRRGWWGGSGVGGDGRQTRNRLPTEKCWSKTNSKREGWVSEWTNEWLRDRMNVPKWQSKLVWDSKKKSLAILPYWQYSGHFVFNYVAYFAAYLCIW